MTAKRLLTLFVGLLAFQTSVVADSVVVDSGGDPVFEFTGAGGAIPDADVGFFLINMDPDAFPISFIELEITGLSHASPMDLNIFLIDPLGRSLEIMDDRGNQFPITDVDLLFSDKAAGHLPPPPDVSIESGTYFAEIEGGFGQFDNAGTDAWILVVIDDDIGGMGEFDSWTLRGVPEPVTLSLLALGALVTLRRKRR